MRTALKLLLLVGTGILLARKGGGDGPDGPDGNGGDVDPLTGRPKDSEERQERLNFQGKNASTDMAGVHDTAKSEAEDGRATDSDGDGQPDVTTTPNKPSDAITFDKKKLNKKFKHASDFDVDGNNNFANQKKFQEAMEAHVDAPGTNQVPGTYRGEDVIHYVDPNTGLNVITTPSGEFVSAWELSSAQLQHVLTTGDLGGG
ncbi:hypothetical protein GCM10009830_02030 [Glycomyces endophyticus]|uniref:Colicin D C-terminal domain-containing protein n=1 Tax=Glycomyces endophyticus TaxID=480996 RepID=A0ABP4RTY2_9ACTN